MEIIVTYIFEGMVSYPALHKWARSCGKKPFSKNFNALELLEGDPDKIKCGDNEFHFIDVDMDGVKYILTSDRPDKEETRMLERFHGAAREKHFTLQECRWECYDAAENVIAYRGGRGYYYAIWVYNN